MYRTQSPIFDVLDHPSLRHVKPLPKRRRRTATGALSTGSNGMPYVPSQPADNPAVTGSHPSSVPFAQSISDFAARTLQYYLPHASDAGLFRTGLFDPSALTGRTGAPSGADDDGVDYLDHLAQPGNAKKRKVPANVQSGPGAPDAREEGGTDASGREGLLAVGQVLKVDQGRAMVAASPSARARWSEDGYEEEARPTITLAQVRRLSRITRAGMAQKELLKARRRQLAPVLEALTSANALALEQALSTTYPEATVSSADGRREVRVRLSRRRALRAARRSQVLRQTLPAPTLESRRIFDADGFVFKCLAPASDRYATTREEVIRLHDRFEEEFTRQAAQAAEAARQAAAAAAKPRRKRGGGQSRSQTHNATSSAKAIEQAASALLEPPLAPVTGKKKKKKRSVLANQSNPHHLRNYVPSRVPQPGQAQTGANAQNTLAPLPLRFLSAELPPRAKRDLSPSRAQTTQATTTTTAAATALADPAEEWICPWCEYSLFYADELALGRAVRARKKILKRRRRAIERAAAAANGKSSTTATPLMAGAEEDQEALFEAPYGDVPASTMAQTRWKSERKKEPNRNGS